MQGAEVDQVALGTGETPLSRSTIATSDASDSTYLPGESGTRDGVRESDSQSQEKRNTRLNSSAWDQGFGRIGELGQWGHGMSVSQEVGFTPNTRSTSRSELGTRGDDTSTSRFSDYMTSVCEDNLHHELCRLVNAALISLGATTNILRFPVQTYLQQVLRDDYGIESFDQLANAWSYPQNRKSLASCLEVIMKRTAPVDWDEGHIIREFITMILYQGMRSLVAHTLNCRASGEDMDLPRHRLFGDPAFHQVIVDALSNGGYGLSEEHCRNLSEGVRKRGSSCVSGEAISDKIYEWELHMRPNFNEGRKAMILSVTDSDKKMPARLSVGPQGQEETLQDQANDVKVQSSTTVAHQNTESDISSSDQQAQDVGSVASASFGHEDGSPVRGSSTAQQVAENLVQGSTSDVAFDTISNNDIKNQGLIAPDVSQLTESPQGHHIDEPQKLQLDSDKKVTFSTTISTSQAPADLALSTDRKPDLHYPFMIPMDSRTHLHGCWTDRGIWVDYIPPISFDQLPTNTPDAREHWVGRFLPDGKFVVNMSDRKLQFIHPDCDSYPAHLLSPNQRGRISATQLKHPPSSASSTPPVRVYVDADHQSVYPPLRADAPAYVPHNTLSTSNTTVDNTAIDTDNVGTTTPDVVHVDTTTPIATDTTSGVNDTSIIPPEQQNMAPGRYEPVHSTHSRSTDNVSMDAEGGRRDKVKRRPSDGTNPQPRRDPPLYKRGPPDYARRQESLSPIGGNPYDQGTSFTGHFGYSGDRFFDPDSVHQSGVDTRGTRTQTGGTPPDHGDGGSPGRGGDGGRPFGRGNDGGRDSSGSRRGGDGGSHRGGGGDPDRGDGGGGGGPPDTGRGGNSPFGRGSHGGGGGGPGGPPPPYSPYENQGNRPPARSMFVCKPSLSVYKDYADIAEYSPWHASTVAALRAHGLGDLLNPYYHPDPNDAHAMSDWDNKNAFAFMMLDQRVLTNTGKRIVQSHRQTGNAQAVFRDLADEARTSTHAALSASDILGRLTSIRYDSRGSKTAMTFITDFETMIDRYNELQTAADMTLTGLLTKTLLQNAVADVNMLLDVSNQEKQAMARGAQAFSYTAYLQLLKSAATLYDRRKIGRSSRYVNNGEIEPARDDQDIADEITAYLVNEMGRRTPGSTMNKATWDSLSKEGRTVWDTLSDGDKRHILQYAHTRAERPALQANQHSGTTTIDTTEPDGVSEDVADDKPVTEEAITAEINNAVGRARSEAHPGDTRRMMGGPPKKRVPLKGKVKFANWEPTDGDGYGSSDDEIVDGYWNSDSDSQDFHRGD